MAFERPLMTIWLGELMFATSMGRSASSSRIIRVLRSLRMTAAMPPSPTGTASCMRLPRMWTMRSTVSSGRTPAATRAVYSPRLCPPNTSGVMPYLSMMAFSMAISVTTMLGWA